MAILSGALGALSFIGPILAGWLFVQRIWPDAPPGLRLGLSASLSFGFFGTVYFLGLLLFDASSLAFATSECALAAAIVILAVNRRRSTGINQKVQRSQMTVPVWLFGICAVVAGAAFFFALNSLPHGSSDAFVLWNMKARFINTSKTSSLSALLDPVFLGLHPDYPLLLPALTSRGWQYTGGSPIGIPMATAALFTVATILVTVAGLRLITTKSQSWLAGCILLGTPFLVSLGAWQYADIVICCFMTTAIILYTIYDADSTYPELPLLAGLAAGAAACTKNEGVLFLVLLLASRATVVLRRKSPLGGRELLVFGGGAAFGALALALWKSAYSPSNDTIQVTTVHAMLAALTSGTLNRNIIDGIRQSVNFGQWRINPAPLMALHAAVAWKPSHSVAKARPWFTPAFVLIGMFVSYYFVYLLSPYDVEAHVQSSLDRLLIQLWPIAIILYSVMTSPGDLERTRPVISRWVAIRVAAVLAAIAVIMVWSSAEKPPRIAGSRPQIEVSRTEVTVGDTYRLKITGVGSPQVYVSYSLDGKPMGQFGVYLGTDGAMDLQVSRSTPKGTYRFLAVRSDNNPAWITFDDVAVLTVR